jgi:hypothetical protein
LESGPDDEELGVPLRLDSKLFFCKTTADQIAKTHIRSEIILGAFNLPGGE